ncbi:MAG: metal ABC transporter permease [Myxococcota bacterium]
MRGLLAALVIGPLLGGVGTLVVQKRLVFFTQTLGHASLTGVALGLLLGEPLGETHAGLYGFTLAVGFTMVYLSHRGGAASETVVGVVLAQVLGLGIVLLVLVTQRFDVHQVEAVLFGSLVTLTDRDLGILLATAVVAGAFFLFGFSRFWLVSLSPELARARGVDPMSVDYAFVLVLTVVIVASLKLVGSLLVLALVVMPPAAAQNLARDLRGFLVLSAAFGAVGATGGLLLSAQSPVPIGGAIVFVTGGLYALSLLGRPLPPASSR